jgi:hypothetical protein
MDASHAVAAGVLADSEVQRHKPDDCSSKVPNCYEIEWIAKNMPPLVVEVAQNAMCKGANPTVDF